MNRQQLKRIDHLLADDLPLEAIARELGMSYGTLRVRMAQAGIRVRRILVDSRTGEPIEIG